ncbi:MAG: hypothetical protein HC922_05430 [Leptolyngbyaceae cyanobacterium SM2_3_12]|nr:hypothetical protein [Leptolyngbyaceae cyanobacterium SM2_3_12]
MAQPTSESFDIATVFAHPLDDRQAATVYLRSIPVITFLGGELATLGDTKASVPASSSAEDPLVRASSVLERLQRLNASSDPGEIKVRWDEDQSAYIVAWGSEDLLRVDDETMLPDTTQDHGDDALQMAIGCVACWAMLRPLPRLKACPSP